MKQLLTYDLDFQCKCLLMLYERQTLDEKIEERTTHKNNMGFNTGDSSVLTVIAEDLRNGNGITLLDRNELKYRMPKYAFQLLNSIADEEIM